ncbi:MAG: helix-turn-helix transcriptional regulator [Planctomycetota bacterium]|nr:helix-turn-helix transcriptional regulator [Planctomycetota bacterium]
MFRLDDRLRAARKRAGLRQEELAQRLNITRGAVSHWESGSKKPSRKSLQTLTAILKISLDYLVKGQVVGDEDRAVQSYLVARAAHNALHPDGRTPFRWGADSDAVAEEPDQYLDYLDDRGTPPEILIPKLLDLAVRQFPGKSRLEAVAFLLRADGLSEEKVTKVVAYIRDQQLLEIAEGAPQSTP